MIKGLILQEDIIIININVPQNTTVSNYVRQKLLELQRGIDESTNRAGDFNTPHQKW